MRTINYALIQQVTTGVKNQSEKVQSLKAQLHEAELEAQYNNEACAALFDAAADEVYKEIILQEGGKWDNNLQRWDEKGMAILENLAKLAKDDNGYYYNYDNKKAVALDTQQRSNSFRDSLKKEYIRTRRAITKERIRKGMEERIKESYLALISALGDEKKELAISSVALSLKVSVEKVKETIE